MDNNEHELIKNVFDFNERVVKNIMVPRTKISGIELTSPKEEVIDTIIKEGYSRLPVYDDVMDKIVGIIHAKDILHLVAAGNQTWTVNDIFLKHYFLT